MEFKGDEQEALRLAAQIVAQPPVMSGAPLPAHGMVSSNFVFNAPLFTWIVAAFWSLTRDPVGVTSLIALVNTGCLIPLWLWARRHMDDSRALLTLAITAASPFAVLLSRKIWTQDLLLAGLVVILWSCEWLRGPRPWRGVAALLVGVTAGWAAAPVGPDRDRLATDRTGGAIRRRQARRQTGGTGTSVMVGSRTRDWRGRTQRVLLGAIPAVSAHGAHGCPE